jgi:hypothetical protein
MNARGALVIDPRSGDPVRRSGFVVDVRRPADVTVHGNYTKGFFVSLTEAGIERGPYRDPATAALIAEHLAGTLERAN